MKNPDDALFEHLRTALDEIDPVPADLADRMIVAVAVTDVSREYALLTLIENAETAVRGDSETTTLQFSDGAAGILLHISRTASGRRRVDGWVSVDAGVVEVRLTQGERSWTTVPNEQGRCAFDEIPPALTRVRVITTGAEQDLLTPQFEA